MLVDRYGPRLVILAGLLIRIAGFLMLGLNTQLAGVIAGVVMIGFAAAQFSPSVESSIAHVAGYVERETGLPRTQVFAMGTVSLQLGATVGPLIGALLLVNYRLSCLVAAGVFACMWLAYLAMFPNIAPLHKSEPILEGWREILGNRMFLLFALANSTYLVAYNQLYLALPVELKRSLGNDRMLGILMALSAHGHHGPDLAHGMGALAPGWKVRHCAGFFRHGGRLCLSCCHEHGATLACYSHGPSHHRSP